MDVTPQHHTIYHAVRDWRRRRESLVVVWNQHKQTCQRSQRFVFCTIKSSRTNGWKKMVSSAVVRQWQLERPDFVLLILDDDKHNPKICFIQRFKFYFSCPWFVPLIIDTLTVWSISLNGIEACDSMSRCSDRRFSLIEMDHSYPCDPPVV